MKRSIPMLLAVSLLAGLFTVALTTPGAGQVPANLPRVLEAQRLLVAQEPDNASAWNDLGNLLALAGDEDAAEDAYRRAVELDPDSAAYHYNLALLLQEADRFKRAAEQYRRVLELAPDHAWAHYQLGVIQEEWGRDARAIELYGQAFRLDPLLAFPDVNPHVIESDLITQAMLKGYRRGLAAPQAPRMYQEPGRITYMLVRPDDGPPALQEDVSGDGPAPPGTFEESPVMEPEQRRVLDEEDLGQGPVNQAAPQGRAGYRPPDRQQPAGRSPSTVRNWRSPDRPGDQAGDREAPEARRGGERQRGPQGGVVVGGAAGAPGPDQGRDQDRGGADGPPPTTRTVVPPPTRSPRGVGSTGSLEMILEPAQPGTPSRVG